MNIDPGRLDDQYRRAAADWPFLAELEHFHQLPAFLLFAVGSRETNLTNELGDGGHGHGVFQLDDRSHIIPNGFDADVRMQAASASDQLSQLQALFGQWGDALAAYNAGAGAVALALAQGRPADSATTGGDYGLDVAQRRAHLAATFTEEIDMPPAPNEPMAILANPNGPGSYVLQADGGIITKDGATFPDGMAPYVAMASDGGTYNFPAANGAMNYLGLPDADRAGDRYFKDFAWTGGR